MIATEPVIEAIAGALGTSVELSGAHAISGGSINQAVRLETNTGDFLVKWNTRPIPDQFEREAEGLERLASADSRLTIPRPVAHRRAADGVPAFLVIDYLESAPRRPDYDEEMGRGIAELHRTEPARGRFGFPHDNYCGATPQPNGWRDSWIVFYREQRLEHMVERAGRDRGWSSSERRVFERLLDRLDELLVEGDPSLIHGDLWSGNAHVGPRGEPSIIDPAAYYGHREAELGMMKLFGGFGSRVWDAYDEAWPLQAGWRDRLPLYELYHVLNHYVLFGGGYGGQAVGIARRFV